MELQEQLRIRAHRERVFCALNDPEILRQAIPGCESFEAASPAEFKATIATRVGPLSARFNGAVRLSDVVALESYTLTGEGKAGPAGFARVVAHIHLADDGADTLMTYKVKADIGGKLGQLGGGMIERTSKKLAGEFFQSLEALIAPPPVPAAEAAVQDAAAAPAAAPQRPGRVWVWIGAAAALLAAALAAYYLLR